MAKGKSAKKSAAPTADSGSPEPEGQEGHGRQSTPSKAEIVREAVASGVEAPGDIVDFAQKRYGVELTKGMASSYKAQEKAKAGKKADGRAKPGRKPAAAAPSGQTDVLAALEGLKPLMQRFGADTLRRLIDVLE